MLSSMMELTCNCLRMQEVLRYHSNQLLEETYGHAIIPKLKLRAASFFSHNIEMVSTHLKLPVHLCVILEFFYSYVDMGASVFCL